MIIVKITGGLGNQLFQYSTARRISIINKVDMKMDLSRILEPAYPFKYRLDMFNISGEIAQDHEIKKLKSIKGNSILTRILKKLNLNTPFTKDSHIIERNADGPDLRVLNCPDNVYLEGWFSSEDYFLDTRSTLIKELTLKYVPDEFYNKMAQEISDCESVAVHIRRGDYTTNTYFGLLPIDYYNKAIGYIKERISLPVFYIFSNDIEWAMDNLKISGKFKYIGKDCQNKSVAFSQTDYEDLNLMRLCKHQIIANSTYSWWGAWLNENALKSIYYPFRWYADNDAQNRFEKCRFIPSEWIKVSF